MEEIKYSLPLAFGKIHLRGREEKKRPLCHPPRDQGQNDFHSIFRRQTSAYWKALSMLCVWWQDRLLVMNTIVVSCCCTKICSLSLLLLGSVCVFVLLYAIINQGCLQCCLASSCMSQASVIGRQFTQGGICQTPRDQEE